MNKSLAELYLEWLYDQVHIKSSRRNEKTYWDLFRFLHSKEFIWIVPNDDNRVEDGLDLRAEFVHYLGDQRIAVGHMDHQIVGASVLEVLIGLSRRLSFASEGDAESWAWQLIENLELTRMCDPVSTRYKRRKIEDAIDRVVWRTYEADGQGGFFPLAWPNEDQRKVELWYQMSAYIDELHTM